MESTQSVIKRRQSLLESTNIDYSSISKENNSTKPKLLKFGLKLDPSDSIQYCLHEYINITKNLPDEHIIPFDMEIFSQQHNDCTAYSILYQYCCELNDPSQMSNLFLYYNSRIENNETEMDEGAQLFLCYRALSIYGICQISSWNNDHSVNERPFPEVYIESKLNRRNIKNYCKIIPSNHNIMNLIYSNKPVVLGIPIYESFFNLIKSGTSSHWSSYVYSLLDNSNNPILAYHAVVIVGFVKNKNLDGKTYFKIRNSHGEKFGDKGYFYINVNEAPMFKDCYILNR
jgi:hypothetical protein